MNDMIPNRRVSAILIVALFLMSTLLIVLPVRGNPTIIHVPGDYLTIQQAVTAASAGDTILVGPGTYYEEIVVDKSVTIVSSGGAAVTTVDAIATTYGRPFMVIAPYVTIEGFTIKAGHNANNDNIGIPVMIGGMFPGDSTYLGAAHHVTVKDNVMTDSWTGIYVYKSSDNLITGNKIYNVFKRGLQVYDGSSNAEIDLGYPSKNNQIIGNEIYAASGGIDVGAWNTGGKRTDNSGTIIKDNNIHDIHLDLNGQAGIAVYIFYTNSTGVQVTGNTIKDVVEGITAIQYTAGSMTDMLIDGNILSGITSWNIVVMNVTGGTISNNVVTGTGADPGGLRVKLSDFVTITCNKIQSHTQGVRIDGSTNVVAHYNGISGNSNGMAKNSYGGVTGTDVDATNNWWGSADGPGPVGPGSGDKVSLNVIFFPWLTGFPSCSPPTVPVIQFPANNSVLTTAQQTHVDWTDSTGITPLTYQYEALSDLAYTALIYSSIWLSASEIPTPGTPAGVYYVRVRARDGWGNTSDWSNGSSNPYKITVVVPINALSPAKMWIGLKNTDDVGTKFDLLAEVFNSDGLVGSGQLIGVSGGSSGFNKAVNRSIAMALSGSPTILPGDTLSFTLSVRISATSGHRSGTARLWFNDVQANSSFDATIGGVNKNYYLLNGFALGAIAGPGPKQTIDVFVDRLVGGNPWKPFGTWSIIF
jgi:parallel beta-helix repeat protein